MIFPPPNNYTRHRHLYRYDMAAAEKAERARLQRMQVSGMTRLTIRIQPFGFIQIATAMRMFSVLNEVSDPLHCEDLEYLDAMFPEMRKDHGATPINTFGLALTLGFPTDEAAVAFKLSHADDYEFVEGEA